MVGRYWAQIGTYWDDAALVAESSQSPITAVRRRGLFTRYLGPHVTVLLTGERGAGKTELFRALTGAMPSREPGRSASSESRS